MSKPVSPASTLECQMLADELLRRGITNLEIKRLVQGIRDFIESQGHCTVKQLSALQNIKIAMDKYARHKPTRKPKKREVCEPPAGLLRFADQPWIDPDNEYGLEEAYGSNY